MDNTLSVTGLAVGIGGAGILREVTLAVPGGRVCGLIGRNGAGKTTFMRAVMGLIPAQAGAIAFGGADLGRQPSHARARLGIGYMPEDWRLVPEFTVEENILLPVWAIHGPDPAARLTWIYGLMPEVERFRQRRANQLSGGQQKLVALARALICGTRLLLLDEPSEGLAPALARRLFEVLANLRGQGLSVLMAESNETHVRDLLDELFIIERGSVRPRAAAQPAPHAQSLG
jgi:branched-chain amino acid transport system ATP-binding protein